MPGAIAGTPGAEATAGADIPTGTPGAGGAPTGAAGTGGAGANWPGAGGTAPPWPPVAAGAGGAPGAGAADAAASADLVAPSAGVDPALEALVSVEGAEAADTDPSAADDAGDGSGTAWGFGALHN